MSSLIARWAKKMTDPDTLLIYAMATAVEAAGVRYALSRDAERYEPGAPLKLLLAGYAGTRNTGGDVRTEEIARQLRHILGERNVELSALTINPELTAGYFRRVRQIPLPTLFPKFMATECPKHHGVVACEGSMFKSKFSNALSAMLAGGLGLASTEGKLSVGYGGEAGHMDEVLEDFVRKQCSRSLVICRNKASRVVLGGLGVRTEAGTDTAWTFRASPKERAENLLKKAGWDGKKPILAVAPVNPYWWPAKPDLVKTAAHRLTGQYREDHYKSVVFHSWSEESAQRYGVYIGALAEAVTAHLEEFDMFPILVGSEMLDREACEDLAEQLSVPAALFVSDEHDMYDLVAVIRRCTLTVGSRFHAIVNGMPSGVASVGVSMDERINNLFHDRGHDDYVLHTSDEYLGERLRSVMRKAMKNREQLSAETLAFLPDQLDSMGRMGMLFEDEVKRIYPDFPTRNLPRSPENYLPPLSPDLQSVLESIQ